MDFWWTTIVWGVLNLLPVSPLDGGQALRALLDRSPKLSWRAGLVSDRVSLGTGGVAALAFLVLGQPFAALLFGILAYAAFERLRERPGFRIDGLE